MSSVLIKQEAQISIWQPDNPTKGQVKKETDLKCILYVSLAQDGFWYVSFKPFINFVNNISIHKQKYLLIRWNVFKLIQI
jgi:hypothetical protein